MTISEAWHITFDEVIDEDWHITFDDVTDVKLPKKCRIASEKQTKKRRTF